MTVSDAEVLANCPFCGSSAKCSTSGAAYKIYCSNENGCTASTGYWQNEQNVIARWNTRTPIPVAVLREEVARMATAIRETFSHMHSHGYKNSSFSCRHCGADAIDRTKTKHKGDCVVLTADAILALPLQLHDRAVRGRKMRDFMCESEEFNGPKCGVQCSNCKPAIPAKAEAEVGVREVLENLLAFAEHQLDFAPTLHPGLPAMVKDAEAALANLPVKTEPKP